MTKAHRHLYRTAHHHCNQERQALYSYIYKLSIHILNCPTLQNRINLRAIILYKIINHLIDIPADTLLLPNFSTRHHHHCYKVPSQSRINAHLFSFLPFSIRIWNHLSPQTAEFVYEIYSYLICTYISYILIN